MTEPMQTIKPVRLQLSRKAGFNLQKVSRATNGLPAVNCARPGKWGNPLRVGMWKDYTAEQATEDFRRWLRREPSVRSFDVTFGKPPNLTTLRGKNLACWCNPSTPHCHVDVLLAEANK